MCGCERGCVCECPVYLFAHVNSKNPASTVQIVVAEKALFRCVGVSEGVLVNVQCICLRNFKEPR